jgi:hypothetical protein
MRRVIVVLLSTAIAALAATRLYLKDGTYQLVREYQVQRDRIHYYSTERGEWEDIPLDLVDLKRTQNEAKSREESEKEEAAVIAAEDKAERIARAEVEKVPVETGAYLVSGNQIKTIPLAESKIVGDRKRTILKVMSPIPIVSGKGTLEVDGPHAKTVVDSDKPEFYLRLGREERFGIIRLAARKGNRVVEELTIIPVSNEIIEKQDEVAVFRKQVGDGLYKIWPMKPLEPGEFAVVEFTPPGENRSVNIMTWDFSWPGRR